MIDFKKLFIFEMANNHQGDVNHGLAIISEMGKIAREYGLNAAVKLQYRDIDTFIHPEQINNSENKYVSRFLSTRLTKDEFRVLVAAIKKEGMLAVCTPFDEPSVDLIIEHDIDVIKIASASADDWPLITKIGCAGKPVIASTGGLLLDEIDNLYSYLAHRLEQVAILHCISIYPAPEDKLNLAFITTLKSRYPDVTIGYSGHEDPENILIVQTALSLGAEIFERHVGIETDTIKLNNYSMNPAQVRKWIEAFRKTEQIIGVNYKTADKEERDSLFLLKRGVYVSNSVHKGNIIGRDNVFYAFPIAYGQLSSGDFGKVRARFSASKNYKKGDAVTEVLTLDTYHKIRKVVHDAKGIIEENRIVLGQKYGIELSHHYGIEQFDKFGCLIVNLVNREYCKKIIIVFPGQHHPEQKHLKKEETFHVMAGELNIFINGIERVMKKGDIQIIERGVLHSFYSTNGAVIEEISTSHLVDDSYYTDPLISEQDPMQRKTIIERF